VIFTDDIGVVDTMTTDVGRLMGLLRFLYIFRGGKDFVRRNGPDAIRRYVRALRARMFIEARAGNTAAHKHVAWMNTLDPPNCRCGKKGTRIIGSSTFCQDCGPTEQAKQRREKVDQERDRRGGIIEDDRHLSDVRVKNRQKMNANARTQRGRDK
jgi:hypothetical protein